MSIEESKAIVRRWFEEGHNGNWSVMDEVLAPEVVFYMNGLKRHKSTTTPMDNKKNVQNIAAAFPDIHWTVDSIVSEGDKVAVQLTSTGTHTGGPFWGFPPTNKKRRMTQHIFIWIADGKIAEFEHASEIARYVRDMANVTLFKEQEES